VADAVSLRGALPIWREFARAAAGHLAGRVGGAGALGGRAGVVRVAHRTAFSRLAISTAARAQSAPFSRMRAIAWASFSVVSTPLDRKSTRLNSSHLK